MKIGGWLEEEEEEIIRPAKVTVQLENRSWLFGWRFLFSWLLLPEIGCCDCRWEEFDEDEMLLLVLLRSLSVTGWSLFSEIVFVVGTWFFFLVVDDVEIRRSPCSRKSSRSVLSDMIIFWFLFLRNWNLIIVFVERHEDKYLSTCWPFWLLKRDLIH